MKQNQKKQKVPPLQLEARALAAKALGCEPAVAFDFNLTFENDPCFGACAASKDELVLIRHGTPERRFALASLERFKLVRGVGCVSLEATVGGTEIELCRADMTHCRAFEEITVRLETLRKGEPLGKPPLLNCPKCGRPFRSGNEICLFCASKGKLMRRLLRFAKGNTGLLILSGICLLLVSGVSLLTPQVQKYMTDHYLSPAPGISVGTEGGLWITVGLLALCGLLVAVFSCLQRMLVVKASSQIQVRVRKTLYEKIQSLSLTGLSKHSAGDMITRLSSDTQALRIFISNQIPNLIRQGVTLIVAFVLLIRENWLLTLIIVIPIPLLVLLFITLNRFTRRIYERQWQLTREANNLLHDVFSGIREVKVFGTEQREEERFTRSARRLAQTEKRNELIWNLAYPFAQFLLYFGELLTLLIVGKEILAGRATPGELIAFLAYVSTLYGPIQWMAHVPRAITTALLSMSKIAQVLDEVNDMPDGHTETGVLRGEITFENACFGYKAPDYVLKDLTLDIKPGDFIGLVGRSGVGKSTVINLILRMYDLNEGKLLIDGKDIRTLDANAYRSQVGVVLQETYLFNGTIYSNLAYAKPDATREEVMRAAMLAGAHSFIMKLPDGYNTYVGARGNTLSGGEKQRIAIARAILRDPKVLILDEATSSLDTETEKQIQDALSALSKGRTTVAIAHRLSTLRNATKLAVFEKGRLEELGTHDELLEKEGRYYRLVMAQREMNKMRK